MGQKSESFIFSPKGKGSVYSDDFKFWMVGPQLWPLSHPISRELICPWAEPGSPEHPLENKRPLWKPSENIKYSNNI